MIKQLHHLGHSGEQKFIRSLRLVKPKNYQRMENRINMTYRFDKMRIELSLEACQYLGGISNGVTIWSIYSELLNLLSQSNGKIVKRGILIELAPGEIDCSINSLRQKFGIGPKPMTKVMNRFVELGLIRITPFKLASIADMLSVVGWSDVDGYHELERNSGEQDSVGRDNKSHDELEDSLPFFQPQSDTEKPQVEEQKTSDACPTQTDCDVEQHSDGDTSYSMHAREATDERDSEETHSSVEQEQLKTDGKPQSMTDMVNQMTGATGALVIPETITVPQKTYGKPSKGKSQAKSLAVKRSEKGR